MTKTGNISNKRVACLVIGGSAGSFEVIYALLEELGADLPFPVLVVMHRGKSFKSNLKNLFQARTTLKVKEADHRDELLPGYLYLAPIDYHLLVEPDKHLSLDASEPVWFCRPAIDMSFYSAADVYKDKLMAVLLSGANNDGARGAGYIERLGGKVLVQDPLDAELEVMPKAALDVLKHPQIFKKTELGKLILSQI